MMFIELTEFTDESKNNTRRLLVNLDHIVSVRPEYGDAQTGAVVNIAGMDVSVKQTYDQVCAAMSSAITIFYPEEDE